MQEELEHPKQDEDAARTQKNDDLVGQSTRPCRDTPRLAGLLPAVNRAATEARERVYRTPHHFARENRCD